VRAQQDGDGVATIALVQDLGGAGLAVVAPSREAGDGAARLEIEPAPGPALAVAAVTGDPADPGTSAEAAVDGDLETRWSNDDWGGAITLDLGASRPVAGVGVAFYQGDERVAFFELRTSLDGLEWTPTPGGQSAGDRVAIQPFVFPARDARYVRILGFGNAASAWNSYAEVEVYGP